MDKNIKSSLMLDFYGNLLTDKQKEILTLYFDCDSSLSEIAVEFNTSRQAIYDSVKSAEKVLEETESKLKCVEKFLCNREIIIGCIKEINKINNESPNKKLQNIAKKLEKVLQNQ